MRLKLNYEKIKTCIIMLVITFFVPFISLCGLFINVSAADSISGYSQFPLPIVNTFDFSNEQIDLFNSTISSKVNSLSSTYKGNWTNYVLFVRDYYQSGNFVICALCQPVVSFSNNNDLSGWWNGNSYFYFSSSASRWGGIIYFDYNPTTNTVSNVQNSFSSNSSDTYGSKYFNSTLSVNGNVLSNQTYYPFYLSNINDIVLSNNPLPIFSLSASGGGDDLGGLGDGIGTIKDFDGQGFDIDFEFFLDMNPLKILGEEIRDGILTLGDYITDGFDIVGDKIQDLIGYTRDGFSIVSGYVQEISENSKKPTQQQLQEALENSTVVGGVVGVVSNAKGVIDTLFSDFVDVPSADDMEFDIDFVWRTYFFNGGSDGWVLHHTPIHISFAWYESIRSSVTLVITVFMSIGFLMYFIKQVPNLIAGVSGGASAGQSIADFNVNRKGAKQ